MFILLLFIVLCSTLFLSFFEREGTIKYKWTYIVITIVLCAMAAFRPEDVVRDYSTYIEHFSSKTKSEIEVEPSFQMIASAIKYFTNSYIWLFIVYALFINTSILVIAFTENFSLHPHLSLSIWIANFFHTSKSNSDKSCCIYSILPMGTLFCSSEAENQVLIMYCLCIIFSLFSYSSTSRYSFFE